MDGNQSAPSMQGSAGGNKIPRTTYCKKKTKDQQLRTYVRIKKYGSSGGRSDEKANRYASKVTTDTVHTTEHGTQKKRNIKRKTENTQCYLNTEMAYHGSSN